MNRNDRLCYIKDSNNETIGYLSNNLIIIIISIIGIIINLYFIYELIKKNVQNIVI